MFDRHGRLSLKRHLSTKYTKQHEKNKRAIGWRIHPAQCPLVIAPYAGALFHFVPFVFFVDEHGLSQQSRRLAVPV
jgi:hypothetical protein